MFKNKFFLYGLGVGLIAASLILQLASMSNRAQFDVNGIQWPSFFAEHIEQITAAAHDQGYVLKLSNTEEAEDKERELLSNSNTNDAHEQVPTDGLDQVGEAKAEDDSDDGLADDVGFELIITPGMTSIDVAHMAAQIGLISDQALLEEAIAAQGLSQYIQVGVFHFSERPDLDELIAAITQ